MNTRNLKTFGLLAAAVFAGGFLASELGLSEHVANILPESLDSKAEALTTALVGGAVATAALLMFRKAAAK